MKTISFHLSFHFSCVSLSIPSLFAAATQAVIYSDYTVASFGAILTSQNALWT